MKRSVLALLLIVGACDSKKPQFVVGDNFSVWMPEAPTKATSTNDEGARNNLGSETHGDNHGRVLFRQTVLLSRDAKPQR